MSNTSEVRRSHFKILYRDLTVHQHSRLVAAADGIENLKLDEDLDGLHDHCVRLLGWEIVWRKTNALGALKAYQALARQFGDDWVVKASIANAEHLGRSHGEDYFRPRWDHLKRRVARESGHRRLRLRATRDAVRQGKTIIHEFCAHTGTLPTEPPMVVVWLS